MAHIAVFHHVHGLTAGVRRFADEVGAAGHQVTTPDLYDGKTFDEFDAGVAHAEEVGFETILERARRVAREWPAETIYIGFSLGVLPAQMLAQTRPGAIGALLFHGCVPASEFGDGWPRGAPVQIHAMDADPIFSTEGDLEAARELVEQVDSAELFLYPGDQHIFADDSLPSYDKAAATLLRERTFAFLDRCG